MFEYKVKCRHRLGWKEIKLYADTDIEEFFNRNSIDYVRNMSDTVEHRQLKEIERLNNLLKETGQTLSEQTTKVITLKSENERLNNIINEFNKLIENEINRSKLEDNYERVDAMEYCLATLKELKGVDKE